MLHMARKADREIVWGHANRDAATWCSAHTVEQVCTVSLQDAWEAAHEGYAKRGGTVHHMYLDDRKLGWPIYAHEFLNYTQVLASNQRRYVKPQAASV